MADNFEDLQVTLVDENGSELIVLERIGVESDPTKGLAAVKLEYRTIEGEPVICDAGAFTYRNRRYRLKLKG